MIKLDRKKKYFFGILLTTVIALITYYSLKAEMALEEEIVFSPSSSDELSDEDLKTTLDAANKNDMAAVSKLVWHYGSIMSDNEAARKDFEYWDKVLKDAARAGNPEAKKHFLGGNPD